MKKIILTGDRPTGPLHIGHLFGSLENRVKMQEEYETYILVADVQALTDNFTTPERVRDNVKNVVLDNLAAGIDPEKTNIVIQSLVPEIAELTVFFSNLVTIARLERNPTVKTEIAQKKDVFKGGVTFGFLGYPVSQAADILAFQADVVPVGEDQLPMIEQTREIARKFNNTYGDTFKEPEAIVPEDTSRVKGLDGGEKMGKSLDNAIFISDTEEEISRKIMGAVTDTKKIKKDDKGRPEVCTVYSYHEIFSKDELGTITKECKAGKRGCVDCKKQLIKNVVEYLNPLQERRRKYEEDPELVKDIINQGLKKGRDKAKETMDMVREKMKINYDL